MLKNNKPVLFNGGHHKDERGTVFFVNGFDFNGVKRFYTVQNNKKDDFRGWHGHKKEGKYVFVPTGKALIGAVEIDDWKNPSRDLKAYVFELSDKDPSVVFIPPGFVNGFRSLTDDTRVTFFSTAELEDSKKDDIRFPEDYWKL